MKISTILIYAFNIVAVGVLSGLAALGKIPWSTAMAVITALFAPCAPQAIATGGKS